MEQNTEENHTINLNVEYVSLTEIARIANAEMPSYTVQSWIRDYNTIAFMRLWEQEANLEFNDSACDELIEIMKKTSFTLTPKQWVTKTNAVGIRSKQGKGGGTLAHPDIATEFRMWVDPEFRLSVVQNIRKN